MELQTLPFGVGEIGGVAPFLAQERTSSTYPLALPNSFRAAVLGDREGIGARKKGAGACQSRPGPRKRPPQERACQERASAPTASFMVWATSAGSSTSVIRRS